MMDKYNSQVLDIRRSRCENAIADEIWKRIYSEPRTLSTLLLYSKEGLRHWDRHSHAPGYYLRHEELQILRNQAHSIAEAIEDKSVILDLGSALDKSILLLKALEATKKDVIYLALDRCHEELVSTLKPVSALKFKHVRCGGLHGTFADGLAWLKGNPDVRDLPHCLLFIGSTIGNFARSEAARFLRDLAVQSSTGALSRSSIILTVDECKVPTKVLHAYTGDGVLPFTLTGLQYANSILAEVTQSNQNTFNMEDWNASYIPKSGEIRLGPPFQDIVVNKGEKIRFVYSHKYDEKDRKKLFGDAGLQEVRRWTEDNCDLDAAAK
ncbi:4-dimethylallyltryptophan N-methyltransferase easF [Penicillium rolfsii]|nr:4-dimethylallyltryptophan N-methyltransferase easF [Penicillium rolfsii]